MSNKLTRKSLAFGALVALASSAIAGTPAQAAGEVVFAPNTGTSYNTFVTEAIALNASLAPGQVASNISQLKYKIDSATASSVNFTVGAAVAAPATPATTTSFVVSAGATAGTAAIINLGLVTATAATATTSVTVTAFIDSNNNSVLDSGEFAQERTVKFVKYSEVVPTVTLTSPNAGDLAVKATVALADINVEQLGYTAAAKGNVDVAFTTTANPTGITTTLATGTYTSSAVTGLVATDVVTAQATYRATALGTAVSATVAARTIATVTGAEVVSDNAIAGFARPNSAYAVKGTVKNSATPAVGVAGVAVTAAISVTGATLAPGVTLSVNGTVYNGTTALPTALALTSDANGEVLVNLVPTGFVAGNSVTVTFTSQNIAATAVTTVQQTAAFGIVDSQDDSASANRAIAKGGTVSFNLEVKDQFGVAIAGSARIKSTPTINAVAGTAVYTAVVAGKATVSLVDTQTAATPGNDSLKIELETQNASTLNWAVSNFAGFGAASAAFQTVTVAVSATAPGFDSVPTPAAAATKFTGTVAPEDYNTSTTALTNGVSILNVAAALSTTVAGQKVTISGTGLLFRVNGKNYADTVTTFSGANGDFAVTVYGHTAGDQTVTFLTGTTTKTAVITFAAGPAALASFATPAQAQVGQAMDVVVTVTDKWGNPVVSGAHPSTDLGKLTLSSTGTGYFASTTPVTNAAGKATVKYIVGTADLGTAYLSATLDLATDVTVAKSVEFGLTDADVVAGGRRIFVNAEFAKGRTVTVTVDGKRIYSKVQTTDNAVELAFTQKKKGSHTVTVRISGGIVFTEKVSTN